MENEARNDCFKKNKIIYYVKWVESMTKKSYEERMDSTDAKIIEILQDNGRISMKDLGIAVGLTSPAVSERVKRLEEAKIISGYKAIINPPYICEDFLFSYAGPIGWPALALYIQ